MLISVAVNGFLLNKQADDRAKETNNVYRATFRILLMRFGAIDVAAITASGETKTYNGSSALGKIHAPCTKRAADE